MGPLVTVVVWFRSSVRVPEIVLGPPFSDENCGIGLSTSISLVARFPLTCSSISVILILLSATSLETTVVVGCLNVERVTCIRSGRTVVNSELGADEDVPTSKVWRVVVDNFETNTLDKFVLVVDFSVVNLALVATVEILVGLVDEWVGFLVTFDVVYCFFVVNGGLLVEVVTRLGLLVDFVGFCDGLEDGGFVILVGFAVVPKKCQLNQKTIFGALQII